MSKLKQSVGIDVSKDKLDVCFSSIDSTQKVTVKSTRRFDNQAKGFKELETWMKKLTDTTLPLVITMEATGVYYEQLAWFFFTAKRSISVILPNKARQYARCLGLKSKNDKIDSLGLARMGAEQNLPLWQPMSQDLYQLRCLTRELESLHQVKTGFTNQLHALSHTQFANKSTQKRIQQLIKTLQNQINIIEKEIKALVEANTELKQGIDNITQIKGVALISAATVVAETNGFLLIENLKQVVSYAGYDVIENQSGNRAGKTSISKKGNSHIRRILHMPAFNVVRWEEPAFKALYDRLIARGKTKMQAYVAVQKKLLVLMYTLWKKQEAYQPTRIQTVTASQQDDPQADNAKKSPPKKIAPTKARATQDKLASNESLEVFLQMEQSY